MLSARRAESEVTPMTVRDLVSCCYDKIVIYTPCDEEMLDFKDLYKGETENIPADLLDLTVRCYRYKR